MINPQACDFPVLSMTLRDFEGWTDALFPPPSTDMDADTVVMLEIEAHDAGYARGLAFRLAELREEAEAWEASRSPCGIHLHRWPVAVCGRCGA